jgi:hypothetical protein
MKNYNQVEVIVSSKYSLQDLVRWLGTTAQSAIGRHQERAKKIFLKTLKDTVPIYLS